MPVKHASRLGHRRRVTTTLEEDEKVRELSRAIEVSDSSALRAILNAGFNYYWPEVFGELEPTNAISDKEASTFYDIFAQGFDRSGFAEAQRVREEKRESEVGELRYLLAVSIAYCLDGDVSSKQLSWIFDYAHEYAKRKADSQNHGKRFHEIVSEMEAEGYRPLSYLGNEEGM